MRKIFKLLAFAILLSSSMVFAQTEDAPEGMYDALQDFNSRTGNDFTLLRSLDTWRYEQIVFRDDDPGCSGLFAEVQPRPERAYRYELYFGGNVYIYYHPSGQTPRFCKSGPLSSFEPTPIPVSCAIEPRLIMNGYAAVKLEEADGINLRQSDSPNAEKIGEIPAGGIFKVLNGPYCGSDFTYWRVEYLDQTGYAAEGSRDKYLVDLIWTPPPAPDYSQCVRVPRLTATLQGQVKEGDPNRLRAEPDPNATLLAEIPAEAMFDVLEGPVCTPDYVYWRVRYNGVEGWTAEGDRDDYYVDPIGELPPDYSYCPIPSQLTPETEVQVMGDGVNIRAEPHAGGERMGSLDSGETVMLESGPVCTLEFTYWSIKVDDETGWIAEASLSEVFLEPIITATLEPTSEATAEVTAEAGVPTATPTIIPGCSIAPRLIKGDEGAVVGPPSNFRAEPNPEAALLSTIPSGGVFTVLDGPICAAGHLYWQVEYNGVVGWTSEGREGEYYVEPRP